MRSLWFLLLLASSVVAVAANAQDSATDIATIEVSDWSGEFEFDIAPIFGKDLPATDIEPDQDYSEYLLSIAAIRDNALFGEPVTLKLSVVSDPDAFADQDESRVQFEAGIGKAKHIDRPLYFSGRPATKVQDYWQFYLAYRGAKVWDGAFQGQAHAEHMAYGSFKYQDVRGLICGRATSGVVNGVACSNTPGLAFTYEVSITRLWSGAAQEDRWVPKAKAYATSRSIADSFRIFGRAELERRLYDDPASGFDSSRKDAILSLTTGVDIADLANTHGLFDGNVDSLEIGLMYRRRESNQALDYGRAYFAPTFVFWKEF